MVYREKHVGTGKGRGARRIDPVTDIQMAEDSYMEMDTVQISGVDSTMRRTNALLKDRARLVVRERLLTERDGMGPQRLRRHARGRGFLG